MPQILALVLEGRRGRGGGRTGGRRRSGSSSAQYRKLDNNLVGEIWETKVFQLNYLTLFITFLQEEAVMGVSGGGGGGGRGSDSDSIRNVIY